MSVSNKYAESHPVWVLIAAVIVVFTFWCGFVLGGFSEPSRVLINLADDCKFVLVDEQHIHPVYNTNAEPVCGE